MKRAMICRSSRGSFAAENAAVMIVIFLGLMFPLLNLATSTYRFNMACGAAKAGAHAGATSSTVSDPAKGAVYNVPATVHNYLDNAKGIKNVTVKFRVNQSTIAPPPTVTHNGWGQKLSVPPDPDTFIYSTEVVIDCDVYPVMTMPKNGLIPLVPGLTGPSHQTVSAQEVVEAISGLDH
jgi:hypothetical protein